MSDLSTALKVLERARTQLPVTSYFDETLYQQEVARIFQSGPRYLGHELAVPEVGDYYALPQEGQGRVASATALSPPCAAGTPAPRARAARGT